MGGVIARAASSSARWTMASNSSSDSGSRQPAMRVMASTTTPPTIAAPAPKMAMPWSSRTGGESLKPVTTLTAPRPIVRAATAAKRMRRKVGGSADGAGHIAYLRVRAITRRWISLVPS